MRGQNFLAGHRRAIPQNTIFDCAFSDELTPSSEMHGVTANNKTFKLEDLAQFAASESVWHHTCNREILYSEGVRYVVERCQAYQLLDEIALAQDNQPTLQDEEVQTWTLSVRNDGTATLTCEDDEGFVVTSKAIAFTHFPAAELTLWFIGNTLMLPSEF